MEITIDEDQLTKEAYDEYVAFLDNYNNNNAGCTCFISPPCPFCTHPGNPANLVEDDAAWQKEKSEESNVMDITKKFLGG